MNFHVSLRAPRPPKFDPMYRQLRLIDPKASYAQTIDMVGRIILRRILKELSKNLWTGIFNVCYCIVCPFTYSFIHSISHSFILAFILSFIQPLSLRHACPLRYTYYVSKSALSTAVLTNCCVCHSFESTQPCQHMA